VGAGSAVPATPGRARASPEDPVPPSPQPPSRPTSSTSASIAATAARRDDPARISPHVPPAEAPRRRPHCRWRGLARSVGVSIPLRHPARTTRICSGRANAFSARERFVSGAPPRPPNLGGRGGAPACRPPTSAGGRPPPVICTPQGWGAGGRAAHRRWCSPKNAFALMQRRQLSTKLAPPPGAKLDTSPRPTASSSRARTR
jgi:hypothetical protein